MRIWKYPIQTYTELQVPKGAKVLTVQMQNGEPQIWMLVNTEMPFERRVFQVFGTGHLVPDDPGTYIATFQVEPYVFHVFEIV